MVTRAIDWSGLDEMIEEHPAISIPFIRVDDVIARLEAWRVEMEEAGRLDDIRLRADVVLFEVCGMLELSPDETAWVMGESYQAVKAEIEG